MSFAHFLLYDMVRFYLIITGSLLMFVCVMMASIEYGNMVSETLDSYICIKIVILVSLVVF